MCVKSIVEAPEPRLEKANPDQAEDLRKKESFEAVGITLVTRWRKTSATDKEARLLYGCLVAHGIKGDGG